MSFVRPLGQPESLGAIGGPTYVTAQSLVQQVAYSLCERLFTYSTHSIGLDTLVSKWLESGEKNAKGCRTSIYPAETRLGAGNLALGYMHSRDFDVEKRHIPQGFLATSSDLRYLRPALEQLCLLYSSGNPFVAHVAAVDYTGCTKGKMVTDYSSVLAISKDLGLGLISSISTYESQHMALLATAMAQVLPTCHIYDGLVVGRETTRVIDALDQPRLNKAYHAMVEATTIGVEVLDQQRHALRILEVLNEELGTEYGFFEYSGHASPDAVIVTFGSVESSLAAQVATVLSKQGCRIGSIHVRVYRPFVEEEFLRVLPRSVQVIGILGQVHSEEAVREPSVHSSLYEDTVSSLAFCGVFTRVDDVKYARSEVWTPVRMAAVFQAVLGKPVLSEDSNYGVSSLQLVNPSVRQYSFWDSDSSSLADIAATLAHVLAADSASNVTMSSAYDNEIQGGTVKVDIRKSSKSLEAYYPIEDADTVVVGEPKLLEKVNILERVNQGGNLILKLPGVGDKEVEKELATRCRNTIARRGIRLFVVDPLSTAIEEKDIAETYIIEVAFIRVALGEHESAGLDKLATLSGQPESIRTASDDLVNTLREIEVPKLWAETELENDEAILAADLTINNVAPYDKIDPDHPSQLRSWQKAAKGLLFKEAYNTKPTLRPDLPTKTYTIHVKENRRLTPVTYDRNIFHVEFDLGDSGMKYDIGEALGIHAENFHTDVMDFINFYGLDPEEVVEIANRDDPSIFENRTIYQTLIQNVDIFGRPPKGFYEALADFALDPAEEKTLRVLGGPEGSKEFQRRAEVDTITYADVLLEFSSAHPPFHDIARLVSPMKRREYSIASCQAVTPTAVALMIVVVNWVDPKGRDRFGQATRFLSRLKLGASVIVSLKPSVMKLPSQSTQPLIMAGLGTGLAPFRAFIQHRAMEKANGKPIGSVLLYMGSRHQREEYCYGEEWEAYQDAGVITLLGRAFSRDQPQKIYIQDRMRQTLDEIIQAYIKEEGSFYLCGPTWPVPDVTNVLEEAIATDAKANGVDKVNPRKTIEKLKEDGRYVLEVY